ncbi:HEPN domain-containing protein [Sulfurimonas sp.]|uniref:HEPN domain-containing protein n=1 Tax=Sulfurimonas sp. TaxID=2022749 RepID=UPI002AB272D2|nr:HEPN domain-containing protein [Sulfurimonas sp.]
MPNKVSAIEWLRISYHDLKSAEILLDANHYTDSIGNDLQQSLEKMLKAIFAYNNQQIKKSHDLVEIYVNIKDELDITENEIDFLEKATQYFKEDRYPNPYYSLPPKEEIIEILEFTQDLYEKICKKFKIEKDDIK